MNELFLLQEIRSKNKVAFDFIFNYYYSTLCAYSMQFINDRGEVEDLVQDLFITLWVEAPKLHIQTSLRAYLFTSIKNRCLDLRKHLSVVEKHQMYTRINSCLYEDSTDNLYSESELRLAIQKSLLRLSPRCRQIFVMSRYNGISNIKISEQLKLSKRTVELQISKALKILRKELIEFLPLWIFFVLS